MTHIHKPNLEALIDRVMESGVSLPMPQTMYDRWIELIVMNDYGGYTKTLKCSLSDSDYVKLEDYSKRMQLSMAALMRVFVRIGLQSLQVAEMQDEKYKAQYHMREALKRLDQLSPNDRRTIREYIANVKAPD